MSQSQLSILAHCGHSTGGVFLIQRVHFRHHVIRGSQLEGRFIAGGGDVGLGEGPFPIGASQVDDAATVVALTTV